LGKPMAAHTLAWTAAPAYEDEAADRAFQEHSLQGVSRTFALTIPQLPERLATVVGNAYLLCRIADTIEDCQELSLPQKQRFYAQFLAILDEGAAAEPFARELAPLLAETMTPEEQELIANTPRVVRLTRSFSEAERAAMVRCVRTMAEGMDRFQESQYAHGVRDMAEMDSYCYFVAGVVGEMLTELFCAHDAAIAERRDVLAPLAISFGQGLQMTNILKDIWDDKARGVCWLPREVFERHGYDLTQLTPGTQDAAFDAAMEELVAVAHAHLRNALQYTLAIPRSEVGIRKFCLWAIAMAVQTLDRIHCRPRFTSGAEVKISRGDVGRIVVFTRVCGRSNLLMRAAFAWGARRLPKPGRLN
jgi:farnesyl-diphosphate farnesyltransferase